MLQTPLALSRVRTVVPHLDPQLFDSALAPRITLLWGARAPTRSMLAMLTLLAARGRRVRTFDGGNCFDGYFVARLARRLQPDAHALLERIQLSRAFTCFQLVQLLETSEPESEPLFVLNLLDTFYDESVPLREVERLLTSTVSHLKRLAAAGPVIVSAQEPRNLVKDRWPLLDRLQAAADGAWLLRPPQEHPSLQPRLFE